MLSEWGVYCGFIDVFWFVEFVVCLNVSGFGMGFIEVYLLVVVYMVCLICFFLCYRVYRWMVLLNLCRVDDFVVVGIELVVLWLVVDDFLLELEIWLKFFFVLNCLYFLIRLVRLLFFRLIEFIFVVLGVIIN